MGKILDYYLRMEPHLFDTAMEKQLAELQEEKEKKEQQARDSPPSTDQSELVLYRLVVLQSLLNTCILQSFLDG